MSLDPGAVPKGKLVAIGGNEDKEADLRVLRTIVDLPEGGSKVVEVITTASGDPEHVGEQYVKAFGKIGIPTTRIMSVRSRGEAKDPDLVRRLREADVVFLTGGDQLRLTTILGGSPVHHAIKGHYLRGGVVAGTSAGAAAMSGTMIFQGEAMAGSLLKGNVQMTPGLGLVAGAVIDTHFINRGRFSRLIEVVASNPGHVGLGVGEDTAVIVRDGHDVSVIGTGVVVVVDGHQLGHTNISDIELGKPIAVENLLVHTLVDGHGFDLAERRYLPPKERRRARDADP